LEAELVLIELGEGGVGFHAVAEIDVDLVDAAGDLGTDDGDFVGDQAALGTDDAGPDAGLDGEHGGFDDGEFRLRARGGLGGRLVPAAGGEEEEEQERGAATRGARANWIRRSLRMPFHAVFHCPELRRVRRRVGGASGDRDGTSGIPRLRFGLVSQKIASFGYSTRRGRLRQSFAR
jgi:hypothetical protein